MTELLHREIFRPVATIVVPGTIALAPYLALILVEYPVMGRFAMENTGALLAFALLPVIAVGLVLEQFGARIELGWDYFLRSKSALDHHETWEKYLGLNLSDEVVGQRYLRTVVLHLKFELAMIPAVLAAWVGVLCLQLRHGFLEKPAFIACTILAAAFLGYLIFESYASAHLASRTRKILVKDE